MPDGIRTKRGSHMLRLTLAIAIVAAPAMANAAEMWTVGGSRDMRVIHKIGSGRVCYVHRLSNSVTRRCYGR